MTTSASDAAFETFTRRCRKDLQRIAYATRGELQPDDVAQEAWLMARDLTMAGGSAFDFDAAGADELILSHLFQALVRWTDVTVRHAVQLDHGPAGSPVDDVHPLSRMLVGDEGRGPLETLQAREEAVDEEAALDGSGSLAVAYVRLLRHLGNDMRAVAGHLLISTSWAYRRCARARVFAVFQRPMETPMMPPHFMPGPWRPFKLNRVPLQLSFDFAEALSLEAIPA